MRRSLGVVVDLAFSAAVKYVIKIINGSAIDFHHGPTAFYSGPRAVIRLVIITGSKNGERNYRDQQKKR